MSNDFFIQNKHELYFHIKDVDGLDLGKLKMQGCKFFNSLNDMLSSVAEKLEMEAEDLEGTEIVVIHDNNEYKYSCHANFHSLDSSDGDIYSFIADSVDVAV